MSRVVSFLIAVVFFLFGASAVYVLIGKGILVVNPGAASPSPTVIVVQASPTVAPATPATSAVPSPTATPSPSPEAKATIKGTLGYPSEGIPPMHVYAISTTNSSKYFSVDTAQNASSFTITGIEPGTYGVVAYPQGANNQLTGGYTKAVPCGLSVNCTDHSLIPVAVESGKTATGVEVKDWYAPAGTFPAKPQ